MLVDVGRVTDFEIVFGFVAPIGTDLDSVFVQLKDELRVYDYGSESIRLSHLLDVDTKATDSFGYYKARMDKGDELRASYGSGDVLAALAVARMIDLRANHPHERRFAWLLRTLKHEDEVALLRQTYGRRFVLVGVYQDLSTRLRNLSSFLQDEAAGDATHPNEAGELMRRDEMDLENEYGQHGRDVYADADYLIDLNENLSLEVARMVGILFGDPYKTPTRDEVAMFHAFGASLRSADPGRQVGTSITTASGEVLSTGSNEVPKFGGGEYWTGDRPDGRDFAQGHDYNKKQTRRALSEALAALNDGGFLAPELSGLTAEERLSRILGSADAGMKQTRILSLIEFGRIVHAEMAALMQAARLGTPTHNATLYTTAFPCHMCMRLVVSSGITRVVYVDPYPKSLAVEMYSDSITLDHTDKDKVLVEPFRGVSWNIYSQVFVGENRTRTPDGNFAVFSKPTARFRLADSDPLVNAAVLEAQIPVALSAAAAKTEQGTGREDEPNTER